MPRSNYRMIFDDMIKCAKVIQIYVVMDATEK